MNWRMPPIAQEIGRVFLVDFVLRRAGERALRLVIPERIVIEAPVVRRVDRALELIGILGNPAALDIFQLHDEGELFARDSGFVVNVAG